MKARGEEEFVYRVKRPVEPMDLAAKRMALGAGVVSALVIGVALVWSGVHGPDFGPPPVIAPPPGPIRVAPADPGGLTVPEANVQIMSGDTDSAAAELAPAPAAPDISQLDAAAGLNAAPVAAPAPVPAPAAVSGPVEVQLAATVDEQSATTEWGTLRLKYPDLLAGKSPLVVPAVVDGENIWRVRLGGFASAADAKAFCARLIAKGAACTVAAF